MPRLVEGWLVVVMMKRRRKGGEMWFRQPSLLVKVVTVLLVLRELLWHQRYGPYSRNTKAAWDTRSR